MKFIQSKLIVLCLIAFSSCGSAISNINEEKPAWVKKRPISQTYYIGIGVAQKSERNRNYIQIAKDNALNDLASQITVNIASEIIRQVVEKSGMVEDEFKSHIRSSTKADLEGYELVDTWEDNDEYWVYYRLSKAHYAEIKSKKRNRAINLSMDMFSNAETSKDNNEIDKALLFYLQSINPIETYINEPLETTYNGSNIYLMNEIYSSLQHLLSKIELRPLGGTQKAKIGQALKTPLEVKAVYLHDQNHDIAIANLPITFSFMRGSGDLVRNVRTDRFGKGRCQVTKITATDKIQLVKAELDLLRFVDRDSMSVVLRGILNSVAIPSTKFMLEVSGLSAFIESEEIHFGKRINVQHIEPTVKNYLSEKGFTFIDVMPDADLMIKIQAESKRGSEVYGMYSAFADLTFSVIDMATGTEIYKNSLHDVKGIDLNYDKAGLKALENSAKKVENVIIPDLIHVIER